MMGRNILTVDDSASVRMMVAFTLRKEGFEVSEAADGVEALRVLREGGVDLVIADINMPNMNGFDLLRAIRSDDSLRYLPVVVLTTDGQEEKKEEGRRAGATGWIVKPFRPDQLVGVVKRVLG